jgi:hypothetical protein
VFQSGARKLASPPGGYTTTPAFVGLNFTATPANTGIIMAWMAGIAQNQTTGGGGLNITAYYGTGAPPIAGSTSITGTVFGLTQHCGSANAGEQFGFMIMDQISGLTVGTTIWFDLVVSTPTGGGAYVKDVQGIAMEV